MIKKACDLVIYFHWLALVHSVAFRALILLIELQEEHLAV